MTTENNAAPSGLTDERINAIWHALEWRDLDPLKAGKFNEALRLRFARALLAARCDIGLRETGMKK